MPRSRALRPEADARVPAPARLPLLVLMATLALPVTPVLLETPTLATKLAAQADQAWCAEDDWDDDERSGHCEVREMSLPASGELTVDARPNGGIRVEGWGRNEVLVQAKVTARARSDDRARDLVEAVEISTRGRVSADGPDTERRESWWVSYRIYVPRGYDLTLRSTNGGIGVDGVRGALALQTTNGGIRLQDVGGDVRARTTNGGLDISLAGRSWQGEGLDAQTTNGGIELGLPEGYGASLEAGTTNGGFSIDFPITVQGRIGRRISTQLGGGGPPIRVVTTNGGVQIRRTG